MASFFMPKKSHSTAATAHLLNSSSNNTKDSPNRHRRLASTNVWLDTLGDDNNNDNCEEEEEANTNHDTKSTSSFSSSSSDDDSDDEYDSDNEGSINNNDGSVTNDALSVRSSTSEGSTLSYSDMILHSELSQYDDGDLHTLNSLVNKLHAAELKREKKQHNLQSNKGGTNTTNNGSTSTTPTPTPTAEIIDLPSELIQTQKSSSPPHFSPLQTDPNSKHRLSISTVESWRGTSLEIVPTDSLNDILPLWNAEWDKDKLEWEEIRKKKLEQQQEADRQRGMEFQRSRTHNGQMKIGSGGALPGSAGMYHRTHSLPNATSLNQSNSGDQRRALSISSSTHRHYKYGKPPTASKNPNPMVSKSSKKIHKSHIHYALTAGMMLGIRESVGGALGVEVEEEILNWEGWERSWSCSNTHGDIEEDEEDGRSGAEIDGQGSAVTSESSEQQPSDKQGTDGKEEGSSSATSTPSRPTLSQSLQQANDIQDAYKTLVTECERVTKYKFPANQFYLGSNTSKPLSHKYKFKVYAPLVFARIRSLFGVEKQTFLHSICGKFNFYEFASNARSGQFFFYSHDGRYMIKTLTYTESKFLREILPHYYRHLTRYPSTFLTHFYGMYRVTMPNANNQRLHFIIMRSVFHTEKKIDRVWDLKGSKAGRKANPGDSVGKDLDILEEGKKLRFKKPKARGKFLEQLARDATFLARLGIMDYSLLLGMHDCEAEEEEQQQKKKEAQQASSTNEDDAPSTPPGRIQQRAVSVQEEPSRSNTPFRRGIIQRASSAGDTNVGNDGFKALELDNTATASTSGSDSTTAKPTTATRSSSLNAIPESTVWCPPPIKREPSVPTNGITSREDMGIEGYGAKLEDGSLAKREIYFCGVIDILQYYNARKVGETVMRKAVGNSGQDISCVDPETYGKRFIKFISNLVEE